MNLNLVEKIKAACMACAIPVLLYLAFTISVYGDTVDANGNNLSGGLNAGEAFRDVQARPPAQTSSTERGDVKCNAPAQSAENTALTNAFVQPSVTSNAASNVQPADAAELYTRLIDERYIPWTEPAILKGNSFADRMSESQ